MGHGSVLEASDRRLSWGRIASQCAGDSSDMPGGSTGRPLPACASHRPVRTGVRTDWRVGDKAQHPAVVRAEQRGHLPDERPERRQEPQEREESSFALPEQEKYPYPILDLELRGMRWLGWHSPTPRSKLDERCLRPGPKGGGQNVNVSAAKANGPVHDTGCGRFRRRGCAIGTCEGPVLSHRPLTSRCGRQPLWIWIEPPARAVVGSVVSPLPIWLS